MMIWSSQICLNKWVFWSVGRLHLHCKGKELGVNFFKKLWGEVKFPLHIYGFLSLKHVRASLSYARNWSFNAITDQKLIRRILQAMFWWCLRLHLWCVLFQLQGNISARNFWHCCNGYTRHKVTVSLMIRACTKDYIYIGFLCAESAFAAKIPWLQFWNHTSIESCISWSVCQCKALLFGIVRYSKVE